MSPGTSAAAIQHHYDVGDEFFALWLDPTLTYSCAFWNAHESLADAQINKLDWHLGRVDAGHSRRLLDVGCGWGSLLELARRRYGVERAVGLTLSARQARWIQARGLTGIEVRQESWCEHVPAAPYDAIVSIGAFEHFATHAQDDDEKLAGYRQFYAFCHAALNRRRRLSLQTITYGTADRRTFSRHCAEQIFPESDLPHLDEVVRAMRGLFEIEDMRNDREHYARTVRHWLRNLRARRSDAQTLVGEERVRAYEKYLGMMVVAFHTGTMNLARLSLRRIDGRCPETVR